VQYDGRLKISITASASGYITKTSEIDIDVDFYGV
jgi:hypothetical protein